MVTTENIVDERVVCSRPVLEDVVYIYKIRYTAIVTTSDDDERVLHSEYRSYYGGIDGTWNEYQSFETLDMSAPGIISLDGRNYAMLRAGMKELAQQEEPREMLVRVRNQIDRLLADARRTN